ncbi:TIGR02680 family protein [Atopostipes suicloacalis]|uniref:TIGR02680 family protein n=1 Tax=Atopostipes suicloacalis TaxID=180295 RepID=UPI000932596F|nr:TIGR02680 family protein [Atopostipes suicloacalis]
MNKWQVNRAGLFNYWYYEDEVFDFVGGKLLLRGNNGSGKSVTMQSFLPVLLDGSTRPERLDPFGSRARKMEDYLLGEKDVTGYEERTGYLYMEFKRKETDQYLTIGIGLQARRGKQLNFWGFVLTDNRRIGQDFLLYKNETHDGKKVKIPLSKIQLRNRIGEGGHVVDTRNEYAQLVNQYVFGYETIEEYEDLIKLLIQLRSPKLSKDYRPTVIHEILKAALAPLSDEDLRYLSDTIEQMDQSKQQLEQIEMETQALTEITRAYTAYNEKVLYNQASGYLQASKDLEKEEKTYHMEAKQAKDLQESITRLETDLREYDLDYETTDKRRQRLEQHKIWNLQQELHEKEEDLEETKSRLQEIEARLLSTQTKEFHARESLDRVQMNLYEQQKNIESHLEDLAADALEASFSEINAMHSEDFSDNSETDFSFAVWNKQTNDYMKHLETISEELRVFEGLKTQYAKKDQELGQVNQELDQLRHHAQKWTELFNEEKNRQLNLIHQWIKEADYLTITEAAIQEMSRALEQLYETTRYEQVREPLRMAVSDYETSKRGQLAEKQIAMNAKKEELDQLKIELEEWKKKKDPNPDTHPLTIDARKELEKKGIQAAPLYSVVEFREQVNEETQKRIEAALIDSGLLDALIAEKDFSIKHDRLLKPNPQLMAYTLADLLKPDVDEELNLSEELVDQVLRSIIIDESTEEVLSISEEGHYSIGLMKGHAIPIESVRFIGRNARKRYKEEQIQRLQQEIQLKEAEITQGFKDKEKLEQAISQAKEHFITFPDDEDLAEGYHTIHEIRFEISQLSDRIFQLSEEVKKIGNALRTQKRGLDQKTKKEDIVLELSAYLEAMQSMRHYERLLGELRFEHGKQFNEFQRKADILSRLDELEEEILQLKGDTNRFEYEIRHLGKEILQIEQQMEQEGVKDIQEQIKEVQEKIQSLNRLIQEKRERHAIEKRDLYHVKKTIEEKEEFLDFRKQLKEAWAVSFTNEYRKGYLVLDLEGVTLEEKAKELQKRFKYRSDQESSYLLGRLSKVKNEQQDYLIEYSPAQRTVSIEVPDWMAGVHHAMYRPLMDEWKAARSRDLVELSYQGKTVSPYIVEKDLKQEQERQKVYLDEQDKQLYEEILFQSVGNKLRSRIGRAERWVEEMKNLMESRNDSSGLKLSIRWKPKTAETEEELDTEDLVSLLRQDPRLLKDDDIDRVTTHFRTRIERAKALMDESTEMQTLLQVLKQVLDYRQWFTFELSFQRAGSNRKRPLTDNQFYTFSGGEKARTMYIPLFIATYSRYLEANEEAPYLISLDEAFAGVDDENIADLFEVIEELDLNYIINSQVLWGDYPTVSELGISELYRPQNADHVAVIRYVWDGNKRKLLTNDEE